MFNPTWFYTGAVYAAAVALARRSGVEIPKRVAVFFYALVFVFLYLPLTQDYVNFDPASPFVALARDVREAWRSGGVPLWSPSFGSGFPLLANPHSSALWPFRITGLPLSFEHAMTFEAATTILIALTSAFLWCRRRFAELPSVCAAVFFAFSPLIAGRLHSPLAMTVALVPAALYALDFLAERRTYARFLAVAAVWTAMIFGGGIETTAYAAALAALYAVWLARETPQRGRFFGAFAGSLVIATLLAAPVLTPFAEAITKARWTGDGRPMLLVATLLAVFAIAAVTNMLYREGTWREWAVTLLLVVLSAASGARMRDANPVLPLASARTPLVRVLDEFRAKTTEPFRVVSTADAAPIHGYEDVRVPPTMASRRYLRFLAIAANGSGREWREWDKGVLDFLNVRYIITEPGAELSPRYRLVHDGPEGRIFQNPHVLPRFFAIRNVILEFRDDAFDARLSRLHEYATTALLDELTLETRQQEPDFFTPRPASSPNATTRITEAHPASYRIRVSAPRWSLIASSIPWWAGWKVERNGRRIEPVRIHNAFLGFAVPPGESDVRVWYDPWTFAAGAAISLATLAGLVGYRFVRR